MKKQRTSPVKSSVYERKRSLRQKARQRRASLGDCFREEASRAIVEKVLKSPLLNAARNVMVYAPIHDEVDMTGLMKHWWARPNCRLFFPSVESDFIVVRQADDEAALTPGAYGILQPEKTAPAVDPDCLDVVFVPALAFDRRGFRLGYGGGYYDRFLPLLREEATKVGVQYEALLWDRLPTEGHDVRMDCIVTELSWIDILD